MDGHTYTAFTNCFLRFHPYLLFGKRLNAYFYKNAKDFIWLSSLSTKKYSSFSPFRETIRHIRVQIYIEYVSCFQTTILLRQQKIRITQYFIYFLKYKEYHYYWLALNNKYFMVFIKCLTRFCNKFEYNFKRPVFLLISYFFIKSGFVLIYFIECTFIRR